MLDDAPTTKTAEMNMVCSWQPQSDWRSADVLSAGEGLDDDHRGTAMPAYKGGAVATVTGAVVAVFSGRGRWRLMQKLSDGGDIVFTVGIG